MNSIFGLNFILLIIFILYPIVESLNYCDDVKEWGFHCENCTSMINCIQLPNGEWQTISSGTCNNKKDEFCNRKEQKCSKVADCAIEKPVKFQCNVEGTFPDPYDCGKYHVCAIETKNLKTFDMECSNHDLAYSTITKECSLKRKTSKFCKNRQFVCEKSGYMAAWPENSQIFYVCVHTNVGTELILYPKLFLCKYGEQFNGQQCINGTIVTTIPPLSSTEHNGEPIVSPTDNPIIGTCKREGLVKNPNDCRKYFICSKNLKKQEINCPKNTHFDDQMKACVLGSKC